MRDHRKHLRKVVHPDVAFQTENGLRLAGRCRDISLGGVFIETAFPAAFGGKVTVFLTLPGLKQEAVIQGTVRWTTDEGMGVQFGLMGARETHALTELLGS